MISKKISFRKIYYGYFLKYFKTLKKSIAHLYSSIALFLAIHGIKLPGLSKIKKQLPQEAALVFERKLLIDEIKGERFTVRKGPLWIRKAMEPLVKIFEANKFISLVILKVSIAIIVILIPISMFIFFRGVLPVPERVGYQPVFTKLPHKSSLKVYWPYTEPPANYQNNNLAQMHKINVIEPTMARGVSITPVLDGISPQGLMHMGIGIYPSMVKLIRGFLTSENAPLIVEKILPSSEHTKNENTIRIQYYLFPSSNNQLYNCKIELKDETGHLIVASEKTTPNKDSLSPPTGLNEAWHNQFTPGVYPQDDVQEFVIKSKYIPSKIIAKTYEIDSIPKESLTLSNNSTLRNLWQTWYPHAQIQNITNDHCIFALGDFSVEKIVTKPTKKRGTIFILVDTLRADTAYNENLMPHLNQFAREKGVTFLEHRAQANMTVPSVMSLFSSLYPSQLGSIAFNYANPWQIKKIFYEKKQPMLPNLFTQAGYRVGAIGWLSLFTEAMEGGLDIGFHNATISENPTYEARHITELAGKWLENYGQAPFFLYLHYNTMHGPYKPPFADINLSAFLRKPFGLNQKKQLYDSLGRYWDKEFVNLLQKIKDLGLENDIDIIITADHGAQLSEQPWEYLAGVPQGLRGGYADKGHSLLDEEVRVPLIVHLADKKEAYGTQVEIPTAHLDLLPTIQSLSLDKPDNNYMSKGLDLSEGFQNNSKGNWNHIVKNRHALYFDAHNYSGVLSWDDHISDSAIKYVRQLHPENILLFLTHNPWKLPISFFQHEIFTRVNFHNHTEEWVPSISPKELSTMRGKYQLLNPANVYLKLTPYFTGPLSFSIDLNSENSASIMKNQTFKNTLLEKKVLSKNTTRYYFQTNAITGEEFSINIDRSTLKNFKLLTKATPVLCPHGIMTTPNEIPFLFHNSDCIANAPTPFIVENNFSHLNNPLVIQKTIQKEKDNFSVGVGAGQALQQALKDWGYAK